MHTGEVGSNGWHIVSVRTGVRGGGGCAPGGLRLRLTAEAEHELRLEAEAEAEGSPMQPHAAPSQFALRCSPVQPCDRSSGSLCSLVISLSF